MAEYVITDQGPQLDGVLVSRDAFLAALAADPDVIRASAITATRTALADALNLATLYPAPSPEENAIIDAQVAAALADFRDLSSPPADVVALAAAVVSWRATT